MNVDVYEQILKELSAGELSEIERKVFDALKAHPKGLNRQQLVAIVFGEMTKAGSVNNNNTKDRKVRKAIETLRARLVPIVSSSGRAGYRLDVSREAREKMIADLRRKRASLDDLIARAAKFYSTPETYTAPETATQARML